jgi:hypothetical protein
MQKIVTFIQNALMLNSNDSTKIGLSQFRGGDDDFSVNKASLRSNDVKLSDLLRRN